MFTASVSLQQCFIMMAVLYSMDYIWKLFVIFGCWLYVNQCTFIGLNFYMEEYICILYAKNIEAETQ